MPYHQLLPQRSAAGPQRQLANIHELRVSGSDSYALLFLFQRYLVLLTVWLKKRSQVKLDGHGRARREAARRRKSEWKVNLDIRNSSRGSASKRL